MEGVNSSVNKVYRPRRDLHVHFTPQHSVIIEARMTDRKSQPIIDAAYRLAIEINQAVVKYPRHQRSGLGRRMEEAALDLLELLVEAQYLNVERKREVLASALRILDRLRLLMRMSAELAYLPMTRYEEMAKTMREVGRMLGGWQKNVGRKS